MPRLPGGRRSRPDTPPLSSQPSAPPHYMMQPDDRSPSSTSSPVRLSPSAHRNRGRGGPRDLESDPPPRYDEAISDGRGPSPAAAPFSVILLAEQNRTDDFQRQSQNTHLHRAGALPSSSTFQQHRSGSGQPQQQQQQRQRRRASSRNQSQPPSGLQESQSNTLSDASGSSSSNRHARYRSASPSALSYESQDRPTSTTSKKARKNTRGSKIKKGLENIAFFIIQALD